eukprot:TRINITY_DN913_c0_g1_i10.p1 TRINITY_DN913_c0_g1~~TRINITY_DN913_c0_g1_i10.p1  ORF type:complete len:696 (+),score=135.35 TRINITY_DN913_c0_g1_i10:72-2159(+)
MLPTGSLPPTLTDDEVEVKLLRTLQSPWTSTLFATEWNLATIQAALRRFSNLESTTKIQLLFSFLSCRKNVLSQVSADIPKFLDLAVEDEDEWVRTCAVFLRDAYLHNFISHTQDSIQPYHDTLQKATELFRSCALPLYPLYTPYLAQHMHPPNVRSLTGESQKPHFTVKPQQPLPPINAVANADQDPNASPVAISRNMAFSSARSASQSFAESNSLKFSDRNRPVSAYGSYSPASTTTPLSAQKIKNTAQESLSKRTIFPTTASPVSRPSPIPANKPTVQMLMDDDLMQQDEENEKELQRLQEEEKERKLKKKAEEQERKKREREEKKIKKDQEKEQQRIASEQKKMEKEEAKKRKLEEKKSADSSKHDSTDGEAKGNESETNTDNDESVDRKPAESSMGQGVLPNEESPSRSVPISVNPMSNSEASLQGASMLKALTTIASSVHSLSKTEPIKMKEQRQPRTLQVLSVEPQDEEPAPTDYTVLSSYGVQTVEPQSNNHERLRQYVIPMSQFQPESNTPNPSNTPNHTIQHRGMPSPRLQAQRTPHARTDYANPYAPAVHQMDQIQQGNRFHPEYPSVAPTHPSFAFAQYPQQPPHQTAVDVDELLADGNRVTSEKRRIITQFLMSQGVNPNPHDPKFEIVIDERETSTHKESIVVELNYQTCAYRKVRRKVKKLIKVLPYSSSDIAQSSRDGP